MKRVSIIKHVAMAARWQCKPAMSVCQLQVGRRVQALWASAWFEARVLATGRCEDEDEDQGKPCCLIHYIGWPKVWDEWIVLPSQRLRRQTDAVPVAGGHLAVALAPRWSGPR